MARSRLKEREEPDAIYAVGDIHGRLDLLNAIEVQIAEDSQQFAGTKWIVMLGDYVDRGPNAAQVIDHLIRKPPIGFTRICLAGNHEIAMLDFLDRPSPAGSWLEFGGVDTLRSYGIDVERILANRSTRRLREVLESFIPDEHRAFLRQLPILLETPGRVFVHAGLREGVPFDAQADSDLVWIRDDFAGSYSEFKRTIIHGHMPRTDALVTPHRIAIDTGAYATGRLTAVRLSGNATPHILQVSFSPRAVRAS